MRLVRNESFRTSDDTSQSDQTRMVSNFQYFIIESIEYSMRSGTIRSNKTSTFAVCNPRPPPSCSEMMLMGKVDEFFIRIEVYVCSFVDGKRIPAAANLSF